jgi:hypothetical protein
VPVDTNSLILAGITADNSNNKDEAVKNIIPGLQILKWVARNTNPFIVFVVNHYLSKKI